jgi:hypothetical protein
MSSRPWRKLGAASGLKLCGLHTLDSCRIEKAFRHFGHDITDEDHVLEAGLGFAVKAAKGDFIGRDAVLRKKDAGLDRRLVQFRLKNPEPLLFHNEALVRDGEIVSIITSGNYGHHLGGAVGLGLCAGKRPERCGYSGLNPTKSRSRASVSKPKPRSNRCMTQRLKGFACRPTRQIAFQPVGVFGQAGEVWRGKTAKNLVGRLQRRRFRMGRCRADHRDPAGRGDRTARPASAGFDRHDHHGRHAGSGHRALTG